MLTNVLFLIIGYLIGYIGIVNFIAEAKKVTETAIIPVVKKIWERIKKKKEETSDENISDNEPF